MIAARCPPSAARPSASITTAKSPETAGTVRACQVPTPNTRNAPYSSAGEHRCDEHRVPLVGPPRPPQGAVPRVVYPCAFVVPHDPDGCVRGRIGSGPRAAKERAHQQRGKHSADVAPPEPVRHER